MLSRRSRVFFTTSPLETTSWFRAPGKGAAQRRQSRSEEHTSELQSLRHLVCRLLLEKTAEFLVLGHRGRDVLFLRRNVGPYFVTFFFNDTATTEIYTLSLHDALPI